MLQTTANVSAADLPRLFVNVAGQVTFRYNYTFPHQKPLYDLDADTQPFVLHGSGGEKCPILPFPGELSYRCFRGCDNYF